MSRRINTNNLVMRNSLHIIFIYTITLWLLNSCCHTERFESHVFLVTHDTLCLDAYAYPLSLISLEHSAKYNDGYYCLFDKSGLYRGMYSSGRAPFMLAISDKLSVTSQLPSPDSFLQWSDFFVYSDTLFWKNQFGKASFWEETTSQWVPVKPIADIVYEDLDWQIAVLDGGEFGRFTWFMDRKSDNQYIYPILPKRFNRILDTFYLTDKNEIMVLRDPRQGILCDSSLRYENTLLETPTLTLYAGWKVAIVHSFSVAYKNEGGEIITLGKYEVDAGDKFSDRVNYASKREKYTPYGFYQDADCTIEWDRNSVHPGGEADTDVTVYVKYIKGEWAIVDNYTALKSALSAGQNVYLTADIDFGGEALNVTNVYSGTLSGNGHTISNFAVAKTGTTRNPACAIFSDLGDGAEIKDVSFASVSYTFNGISETASSRKVAALAVKTSGAVKISNVSIEGSFTSDYSGELPEVNVAVFDAAEGTVITDFVSNITVNK